METAKELRAKIQAAKRGLALLEAALTAKQIGCDHAFEPTQYVPIITPARTIPGDTPGTMGIDYRGSMHIPREEKKQWQRTCSKCALTQTTTQTKPRKRAGSIPGTTVEEEIPYFPEPRRF